MKKILLAFQFLTIIPIKDMENIPEQEMGRTSAFFPLVGLAEGGLFAVLAFLLLKILPPEVVSALLVLVIVIINGGLHLDGLADTFDAVASRGNVEKKLAIMKDSSIGPVGVISIVIALLLNYVLLNAVHFYSAGNLYFAILFLMPVTARWAMVPSIYYGKSAREDGLGKVFINNTGSKELIVSVIMIFTIALLTAITFSNFNLFLFFSMFIFPVTYLSSVLAIRFLNKLFNGLTGDSFGAVNEVARLIFLTTAVICLRNFTL